MMNTPGTGPHDHFHLNMTDFKLSEYIFACVYVEALFFVQHYLSCFQLTFLNYLLHFTDVTDLYFSIRGHVPEWFKSYLNNSAQITYQ